MLRGGRVAGIEAGNSHSQGGPIRATLIWRMLHGREAVYPQRRDAGDRSEWLKQAGAIAGVAVLYYVGARVGLPMSFGKTNSSPIWFPAGVALAGLLLWGRIVWVGIWLAAFFANIVTFQVNRAAGPLTLFIVSATIATGNTIAALLGHYLYCHFLGCDGEARISTGQRRPMLFRKSSIFKFLGVALAMGLASASVGPVAVSLAGIVPWRDFPLTWLNWCIGDSFGVITVVPFFLAVAWSAGRRWNLRIWAEIAALFTALAVVCDVTFGGRIHSDGRAMPLLFLPFAALVWIALRLGPRLTATAVLVVAGVACWFTYNGMGPLVLDKRQHSLIFLNAYLLVIAVTGLALEALESDVIALRQAQETVRQRNSSLEFLSECLAQLLSHRSTEAIISNFLPKLAAHIGDDASLNFFALPASVVDALGKEISIPADALQQFCGFCAEGPLCESAVKNRTTAIANFLQQNEDPQLERLRVRGVEACLCIPLLVEGRVLGILSCTRRQKAEFDAAEVTLLQLVSGYVAIALDRARASELISERQQRLQIALEIAKMGTWELDITEKIHSPPTDDELMKILDSGRPSPELKRIMGLPVGGYCSIKDWENRIHPEDRERTIEAYRAAIAGVQPLDVEHRFVWPNKTVHWAHCRGRFLDATHSTPKRIIGISADITRHKEAEEAIQQRNERLQLISNYLEQLLRERDPDQIVVRLFKQVASHVGADSALHYHVDSDARVLRLHAAVDVCADIQRQMEQLHFGGGPIGQVAETRAPVVLTDIQHSSDPKLDFLRQAGCESYIGIPLIAGNQLLGVLCFASTAKTEFSISERDFLHLISRYVAIAMDRAEAERALLKAKRAAENASRAKGLFIAALSHELRTPLTPALLVVSSLEQDEALAGSAREKMGEVRACIEMEARLVDDLLDITRIEQGKLSFRSENVDIHAVLARTIDFVREDVTRKRLTLEFKAGATQFVTQADPVRLHQVFWNLINNAIKFTSSGGRIEIHTSNPAVDVISIEVIDTGIGIAKEELSRIFAPFEQGTVGGQQRASGLGLGLAISKSIVELHHGTIQARSGGALQGTCIGVQLPIIKGREVHATETRDSVARRSQHLNILIVEDNEEIRGVLARVLTRDGHVVHAEPGYQAALEAMHTQPHSDPFQVLISDIGLPDGSGLNLVREMKAESPGAVAIAVSGYGTREDVERSMRAGFDAHLTKPINISDLRRAIAA